LRSLDYLIQESNGKILDYQVRQSASEDMDLPLLNEQRKLENLGRRRGELEQEIRLERNLTISEPRWLGTAVVLSKHSIAPTTDPEQKEVGRVISEETPDYDTSTDQWTGDSGVDAERRAEIEAVGMQKAIEFEKEQGWAPEDVSAENLGFDIRSTLYEQDGSFVGIRYIEVKARAQSGAIRLSSNEWEKARHFGEKYWLYIITQSASDDPELNCIPHPAEQFQENEDIFATGFVIPEERWKRRTAHAVENTDAQD